LAGFPALLVRPAVQCNGFHWLLTRLPPKWRHQRKFGIFGAVLASTAPDGVIYAIRRRVAIRQLFSLFLKILSPSARQPAFPQWDIRLPPRLVLMLYFSL
jgi:hypothetical protein